VFDIILIAAGLLALILGCRLSLGQAIRLARHYRLSDVFIGVAVLSLGSDLPEIVVSVDAALHQFRSTDTSGLIIGNALGSSFSQIGLILGTVGLFGYLTLGKRLVFRHGGVLLGSILYLLLASLDREITRAEGSILILAFVVYMVMLFGQEPRKQPEPAGDVAGMLRTWSLLALGLGLVIAGSEATVRSTVSLAESLDVPQSFIAIVIIGIGTSLPELAISLGAILKSRGGMSIGNLIGSNVIDTLLPIGFAAMIHPLSVEGGLVNADIPLLFILSLVVLVFLLRRRGIQKSEAVFLIVFYAAYVGFKFLGQAL